MDTPRKAFLLAAGFGTRMRPLTHTVAKPLMPLWGRPVIDHLIDMLVRWGVREILVNLHHEAGAVVAHLVGGSRGARVQFSFEPELMGTGGALARARWFFDRAPFWMVNTDIAADVSPRRFLAEFEARRPVAALWLHPQKGPRTVEIADGAITTFRGRTPGAGGTYTFCGLQLVSPELFAFLKGERFHSVIEVYEEAMTAGRRVSAIVEKGSFWADLGSPADYLAAHGEILRAYRARTPGAALMQPELLRRVARARKQGAVIRGFAAMGEGVRVRAGARIEDAVVWDGATIGSRADLTGAIVGRGARVDWPCDGPAVRAADYHGAGAFRQLIEQLGLAFESTVVCPLAPRGSNRSFARLACGRRTAMLMHYNQVRPENARFAGHARFLLEQGIPVPRILLDDPGRQLVVAEDIGNHSLQEEAARGPADHLEMLYRKVLDALLALHHIPLRSLQTNRIRLEPAFSSKVYCWERNLMAKYFLKRKLGMKGTAVNGVLDDLSQVAGYLSNEPRTLVHRDMQSSNVLLRRGHPVLIDFQGMRLGPPAYDLAALLCDPYVMLSEAVQERLLGYYLDRCRHPESLTRSFWPAALQRLGQALGAFGRLGSIPGTQRFEAFIPPAVNMMRRALEHINGLPALRRVVSQ